MKSSFKTLALGIILASLYVSPSGLGKQCGNPTKDKERCDKPCNECDESDEDGDDSGGEQGDSEGGAGGSGAPTGPSPSPSTSSVTSSPDTTQTYVIPDTSDGLNSALDIQVFNSLGKTPLEMMRYYKSRSNSGLGDPFGQGQTWSHSYSWGIHSSGSGKRSVAFPTGRVMEFTQGSNTTFDGATAILHLPEKGRGERLYQNGTGNNTYTLVQPNGARQVFERVSLNGGVSYHPRYGQDSGGRKQTYQTDTKGRIIQVTDDAGNFLTLQYGGIQFNNNEAVLLGEVTAVPSTGWNEITLSSPQAFRWLQASSAPNSFFNLAKLEFYGPDQNGNEVLLSGSIYGTGPAHRNAQSATLEKVFDGSLISGYCHNNPSGGIAGIDLGAGNENTVTKIRYNPRSSGSMSQPMASLVGTRFEALVQAPVIVEVLQRVETSDGRAVNYLYNTYTDPSVNQDYLVLSGVDYGDDGIITLGQDATFSWVVSDKGRAPNVGVFNEPRTLSGVPNLQFKYHDTMFATRGQVSEVREASSGELIFSFDPLVSREIKFPGGRKIATEFNSNGSTKNMTDASGQQWFSDWDANDGFLKEKTDPAGRITTMDFNHRGLRTTITRPDGLVETSTYDADNLYLLSNTRSAPGYPSQTTQWVRDADNRVTRINFPDSSYVTYQYNNLGLLTEKRERNGTLTVLEYNGPTGLVTKVTLASNTADAESWDYDYYGANDPSGSPARLLKSVTDPRGRTTTYEYNNRGQRTKTIYPDDSFRIRGYDFVGNNIYETDSDLVNNAPVASRSTFRQYNAFNKLTTSIDQVGHATQYYYGDDGISCGCFNGGGPTLVVSPEGRATMKVYDEQWRVSLETTGLVSAQSSLVAEPATTEYFYDMVGNLAMKIEPGGVTRTYNYDQRNRLLNQTTAGPDGRGGNLSYTDSQTYDPFGNTLTIKKYGNRTTTMTYDVMDRTLTSTDPLGTVMKYTYDSAGNATAVTEDFGGPLARISTMGYDFRNRPVLTTYADTTTTSQTYHPDGAVSSRTDELGRTTYTDTVLTTWKDSANNTWKSFASTSTDALTNTSYSYPVPMGRFGGTSRSVSPLGRASETYRNTDGTTAGTATGLTSPGSSLTPDPTVTNFTYDMDHLMLTRTTDPTDPIDPTGLNLTNTYTYSARGNNLTVTDPLGRTTTMEYDLRGNPVKTTLPDNRFHTATYDALDRKSTSTDPKNQTTINFYRLNTGVLASFRDPKGNRTKWTHNALVQILTKEYANGDTHTYTYDSLHRMATHKTPKNETCTYTYDLRDRQLKTDWNTTTPDTTKTYFANGLLKSIDNTVSKSDYAYSVRNQLTAETQTLAGQAARVVSYSYDADGLGADMTAPSGRLVEYAWTTRAQLAAVTADGPPPFADYEYDKAGRLLTTIHENGITEEREYDPAGQLLANLHKQAGTTVSGHGYTYDLTGRRTAETFPGSPTAPRTYGYDTADQVTSANYGNSLTDAYNYDAMGNRTSATVASQSATFTYTANSANQYSSITGLVAPPIHDANGNLLSQNGVNYTWDSENRLLSVSDGTTTNTFSYDGQHRRVTKRTAVSGTVTEKTHFIYDGWNVIEEYTNADTTPGFNLTTFAIARTYTWGNDLSGTLQGAGGVGGLLLTEEIDGANTVPYYFHYDGNGNVTEITTNNGTSAATYRYDAFGNTLVATGSYAATNKYRFSTKPIDAEIASAPLYYYGYRYYDPVTGRWPSRDPVEEKGGVNLYGFVGNDGVNRWDLLGLIETTTTIFVAPAAIGQITAKIVVEYACGSTPKMVDAYAEFPLGVNNPFTWTEVAGFRISNAQETIITCFGSSCVHKFTWTARARYRSCFGIKGLGSHCLGWINVSQEADFRERCPCSHSKTE